MGDYSEYQPRPIDIPGDDYLWLAGWGYFEGEFSMDPSLSAADLSFILCGVILALGALLVWAIQIADKWVELVVARVKVRRDRG